jgi:hypothetical protein
MNEINIIIRKAIKSKNTLYEYQATSPFPKVKVTKTTRKYMERSHVGRFCNLKFFEECMLA